MPKIISEVFGFIFIIYTTIKYNYFFYKKSDLSINKSIYFIRFRYYNQFINLVFRKEVNMFVVDKRDAKANVQKTIRFTEEIYQSLYEVSKREKVSFNALVLQCCRYALSNMEKKNNKNDYE